MPRLVGPGSSVLCLSPPFLGGRRSIPWDTTAPSLLWCCIATGSFSSMECQELAASCTTWICGLLCAGLQTIPWGRWHTTWQPKEWTLSVNFAHYLSKHSSKACAYKVCKLYLNSKQTHFKLWSATLSAFDQTAFNQIARQGDRNVWISVPETMLW